MSDPSTLFAALGWVQGGYYLLAGLWPLVSIRTFQAVTGPKTDNWTGRAGDHWLVNAVAVLVVAVGAALLVAAARGRPSPEVVVLAVAAILGLTGIDVVYVARRVIPPIYLLDAVAEAALLVGWVVFVVLW
jgi:hypothetical protein